ncbi:MAG TPA: FAD-dependent oxidoreductase [Verrucomicrobiae bacterium]|nr:FAD-dependent oxidoreductase [Verrucomicrobiae bacterium]
MRKIVIIGGGFVGLRVARLLGKKTAGRAVVTLIDRNDRFVFSPWLIDELAGEMDRDDISESYADAARRGGFTFVQGEAMVMDRETKLVEVKYADGRTSSLEYDWLVMAPGAKVAYYGIPGAEEHALPLKSLADVVRLHERLKKLVDRARTATPDQAANLMHFVVVGGGPTGIESLFALKRYLMHELLADNPRLAGMLKFTLVDAMPQILNGFKTNIVSGAIKALERQGVEIMVGDPAASVDAQSITFKSGKRIDGGLILWAAGVQPNDMPSKPEMPRNEKKQLQSDECLRLDHCVYAGGDAVTFMCDDGKPASRTAQTAMQQASMLVTNILMCLNGQEPKPYHHVVNGTILTFGDTGYLDTPWFGFLFPSVVPLRRLFYKFRFWQMTGRWA